MQCVVCECQVNEDKGVCITPKLLSSKVWLCSKLCYSLFLSTIYWDRISAGGFEVEGKLAPLFNGVEICDVCLEECTNSNRFIIEYKDEDLDTYVVCDKHRLDPCICFPIAPSECEDGVCRETRFIRVILYNFSEIIKEETRGCCSKCLKKTIKSIRRNYLEKVMKASENIIEQYV